MSVYEITYNYVCEDEDTDERNIKIQFEGSYADLQEYIKEMERGGCFIIDTACIYYDEDHVYIGDGIWI